MKESLDQYAWYLHQIGDKVDKIRTLSNVNYTGTNSQALMQILDKLIVDLERNRGKIQEVI